MSALFPLIAQVGFDGDHMGDGWGLLVIVAIAVMVGGMVWMVREGGSNAPGSSEEPVDVLNSRYARGELTTEEFQERVRTIEDASDPPERLR